MEPVKRRRFMPEKSVLVDLHHTKGWSVKRIAELYMVSPGTVRSWMDELGIDRAGSPSTADLVHEPVDHFEILPYRTTKAGRDLVREVAILLCGHKVRTTREEMYQKDKNYGPRVCKVCTQRRRESDGRP